MIGSSWSIDVRGARDSSVWSCRRSSSGRARCRARTWASLCRLGDARATCTHCSKGAPDEGVSFAALPPRSEVASWKYSNASPIAFR
jgi:hypothetical protein